MQPTQHENIRGSFFLYVSVTLNAEGDCRKIKCENRLYFHGSLRLILFTLRIQVEFWIYRIEIPAVQMILNDS